MVSSSLVDTVTGSSVVRVTSVVYSDNVSSVDSPFSEVDVLSVESADSVVLVDPLLNVYNHISHY